MRESLRIVLHQRAGMSAKEAREARARAWTYVFECFHRRVGKEGGAPTAPDDRKGVNNDPAKASIQQGPSTDTSPSPPRRVGARRRRETAAREPSGHNAKHPG